MNVCSIPECGKRVLARGWCKAHYTRWHVTGNPLSPRKRAVNGSGTIGNQGYRVLSDADDRKVCEHVQVAEKALGKKLPAGACVHHVNHDKTDNRGSNLVICPDQAYHSLLHRRERALDACGHADWLKCRTCSGYHPPLEMRVFKNSVAYKIGCRASVRAGEPA